MGLIKKLLRFKRFIKRKHRLNVEGIKGIKVVVNETEYRLYNISVSGIAFDCNGDKFREGETHQAVMKIHDLSCSIKFEITRKKHHFTACRIVSNTEQYKSYLEHYFQSELAAAEISYVAPDKIKEDPDGTPHWYHYGNEFELYYTVRDEDVSKFQVTFMGNIAQMQSDGVLLSGQIWDDQKDGMKHKQSSVILDSDRFPHDLCTPCLTFIGNIKKLPQGHGRQILDNLKKKFQKDWPDTEFI